MSLSRPRYDRSQRRLGFESLETRRMFNAADIVAENSHDGATNWKVIAPITVQVQGGPPVERHQSPFNLPWNGFTDSTLQTYSDRIQGFTSRVSYDLSEQQLTVEFKVDSPGANFDVEIYRLGDYGGDGARLVAKLANNPAKTQLPPAIQDSATGLVDASNWETGEVKWRPTKNADGKYVYTTPGESQSYPLLSGVYYAKLKRLNELTEKGSAVVFVLRDDTGAASSDGQPSKIVMQTADTTWQAYNFWGNKSLYYDKSVPYAPGQAPPQSTRGIKVSYNRPYDWVLPVTGEELETIMFLERNGYDVSYTTHVDVDRRYGTQADAPGAGSLRQHKVYIAPGHDEYWSAEHAKALEMARADGVSLMFLSGNESFWKTRWEDNFTTLVTYKETQNNGVAPNQIGGFALDPTDTWTGLWRDIRSQNLRSGGSYNTEFDLIRPENSLTGTAFTMNLTGNADDLIYTAPINVPDVTSNLHFWANSRLVNTTGDQLLNIPVGPEWDHDLDNGFRPAGLLQMSSTTLTADAIQKAVLQDFGDVYPGDSLGTDPNTGLPNTLPVYGAGTTTHSLTMYRSSGTGLVFSAGTGTWSWGLIGRSAKVGSNPTMATADEAVQQATVNMLADMGVQPASPQPELAQYSLITDTTAPISAVTNSGYIVGPPSSGYKTWTVSGSASDSGGGVLAGVELSYDGGATWHPATLTSGPYNWQYVVNIDEDETPFFISRAVDDSYNMEAVKVVVHSQTDGTKTLYVYGGSADNEILITKSGSSTFSVTNHGLPIPGTTITTGYASSPTYSGPFKNIIVQVAIGQNSVTVKDLNFAGVDNLTTIQAGTAMVPGFVSIRGGIGNDAITVEHIEITDALYVNGRTGADLIDVKWAAIGSTAEVDARFNGNTIVDSKIVGARVNLQNDLIGSNLTVNTGNGDDSVTAKVITGTGSRTVSTRGGKDTIDRGAAEVIFDLIGGYGDDTYAYSRTSLSTDRIVEVDGQGSDTFDFSTAGSGINITLPTTPDIENAIGSPHTDSITGNAMRNAIYGNGADTGFDSLTGGGENDTYYVGTAGTAQIYEDLGMDTDVVMLNGGLTASSKLFVGGSRLLTATSTGAAQLKLSGMAAPKVERIAVAGGGDVTITTFADFASYIPTGTVFSNVSGKTTLDADSGDGTTHRLNVEAHGVAANGDKVVFSKTHHLNRLTVGRNALTELAPGGGVTLVVYTQIDFSANPPPVSVTGLAGSAVVYDSNTVDAYSFVFTIGTLEFHGTSIGAVTIVKDLSDPTLMLRKFGSGTFTLTSVSNKTVPVNFVNEEGTSVFQTNLGDPAVSNSVNWSVSIHDMMDAGGSSVEFQTTQNLVALDIAAGTSVTMTASTGPNYHVLAVGSLAMTESGTLDLTNNGIVIDLGSVWSASLFEDETRSWIIDGRNSDALGGAWTGTGITSSTAAAWNETYYAGRSIGYGINYYMPLGSYSTFMGQTVGASAILIRYTVGADLNLDGTVNDDDVTVLNSYYGATGTPGWIRGDLDYDGDVDDDDVTLLNSFYGQSI